MVLVAGRTETPAAARLVGVGCPDENAFAITGCALGAIRRIPAHNTDCEGLGDVLGHRQELRHGIKGPAAEILVKAGYNDPLSLISKALGNLHDSGVKELTFIDADDLCFLCPGEHLRGVLDYCRPEARVTVRNEMRRTEACIDSGLEDGHLLACDFCTSQPADELFGLAAEHAAGDDFDPANPARGVMKGRYGHGASGGSEDRKGVEAGQQW